MATPEAERETLEAAVVVATQALENNPDNAPAKNAVNQAKAALAQWDASAVGRTFHLAAAGKARAAEEAQAKAAQAAELEAAELEAAEAQAAAVEAAGKAAAAKAAAEQLAGKPRGAPPAAQAASSGQPLGGGRPAGGGVGKGGGKGGAYPEFGPLLAGPPGKVQGLRNQGYGGYWGPGGYGAANWGEGFPGDFPIPAQVGYGPEAQNGRMAAMEQALRATQQQLGNIIGEYNAVAAGGGPGGAGAGAIPVQGGCAPGEPPRGGPLGMPLYQTGPQGGFAARTKFPAPGERPMGGVWGLRGGPGGDAWDSLWGAVRQPGREAAAAAADGSGEMGGAGTSGGGGYTWDPQRGWIWAPPAPSLYTQAPAPEYWNRLTPAGSGNYGWKFDADKELPYYDLRNTGIKYLEGVGSTPLRVKKKAANSMLWEVFGTNHSCAEFVDRKPGGWTKGRNRREADTLARVIDLAVVEFGHQIIQSSAAWEVLLRRFFALYTADQQGHWGMASLLEELPTNRTPHLHETLVNDLVTTAKLLTTAEGVKPPPGGDDD